MKRISLFFFLSLVLHFLLELSLANLADFYLSNHKKSNLTEVEIVETTQKTHNLPDKLERQAVKQLSKNEKQEIDRNTPARFESEKNNRVLKETRARNFGVTQNKNLNSSKVTTSPNQEKSNNSDLPEFAKMNYSKHPDEPSGASSISTNLPSDIDFSNATNLNTDATTYGSFYSRVEDLFYIRWSEKLNQIWNRLPYDFKRDRLANKVWITELEIWLTASGEYHSSYVKRQSGYRPFDEATQFAFQDARFFPNPPKTKVESDGFVRLRYRFHVQVGPMR